MPAKLTDYHITVTPILDASEAYGWNWEVRHRESQTVASHGEAISYSDACGGALLAITQILQLENTSAGSLGAASCS